MSGDSDSDYSSAEESIMHSPHDSSDQNPPDSQEEDPREKPVIGKDDLRYTSPPPPPMDRIHITVHKKKRNDHELHVTVKSEIFINNC